jgi:ABC-type nickel/cobalt efflux system permease component RcnA
MATTLSYLQAALPVVIAFLGVYIAWQQWRTNRNQLRLALHKERFEVYEAATQFIAHVVDEGITQAGMRDFVLNTRKARFLFNEEVEKYLTRLRKEALAIRLEQTRIDHPASEDSRIKAIEDQHARLEWLIKELDNLPNDFDRFLRVSG